METSSAEVTASTEVAETDVEAAKVDGGGSAPPAKVDSTSEDTSSWTHKAQDAYYRLSREKYDALGERDRERYDNQALKARVAELEKAKTAEVAPPETFPTLEQFGYDETKFAAAIVAFNKATTESAKQAAREEAKGVIQAERDAEAADRANKNWSTKEAEFIKSKPDYVEKVIEGGRTGAWGCTTEMVSLIKQSEFGPAIALHLAENAEKSFAIAKLSPLEQAREIGRIEAKLEAAKVPPKPVVSQAPPPVKKVDSDDAQAEKDPNDMTDAQFAKWRRNQIAQRRNN